MARNPKPLRIWKARYCRYVRRCEATLGRELGPQDVVGLEFPGPLTSEEISICRSGGLDPDPRPDERVSMVGGIPEAWARAIRMHPHLRLPEILQKIDPAWPSRIPKIPDPLVLSPEGQQALDQVLREDAEDGPDLADP